MGTMTCETVQTSTSEPENKLSKSKHEPQVSHNSAKISSSVDDETDWTEDLMKDITKELDDWDNDCITTKHQPSHYQHHIHGGEYHHDKNIGCKVSTDGSILPVVAPLTEQSISKTDCVSHVSPITVLSSKRESSTLTPLQAVHRHSLGKIVKMSDPHTSPSSEVSVVRESPPFSTRSCIDHQCQGNRQSEPLYSRSSHTDSPTGHFPQEAHSSDKIQNHTVNFRTPSTAEWMKAKRLSNQSTHSPLNFGTSLSSTHTPPSFISGLDGRVLLSGGKVTPPLCECGKRAKRRTVSNPGPNEGKTFYACPNGKASDKSRGCGFFKWEMILASNHSPQGHASSHSYTKLESDYPESER